MKSYLMLLLILIGHSISAQNIHPIMVLDSFSNIHNQVKLIVETNKSAYGINENVYINVSALSVKDNHAITHDVNLKIHLIQLNGSLIDSVLVKMRNGHFNLIKHLSSEVGIYKIKVQTIDNEINKVNFCGETYFSVYQQFAEFVKWDVQFDKDHYDSMEHAKLKLKIHHSNGIPLKQWEIQKKLVINGVCVSTEMDTTDFDACVQYDIDLGQFKKQDVVVLNFQVELGEQVFNQFINLPMKGRISKIEFYPESGSLFSGYENTLVFKGFNEKGLPMAFKGAIVDESNHQLIHIAGNKEGRGLVKLNPSSASKYKAFIFDGQNDTLFFDLPEVTVDRIGIHVESIDSTELRIKIFNMPEEGLKFMVRRGDKVVEIRRLFGDDEFHVNLNTYEMGIHQLLLFSDDWKYICYRSVFLRPDKRLKINVEFDQARYAIGDTVRMKIKSTDGNGKPVRTNLRLNVLAGKGHEKVLPKSSLLSKVLLESEFEFPLIESGKYLEGSQFSELDLLMLSESQTRKSFEEMNQYLIRNRLARTWNSDISYGIAGNLYNGVVPDDFKEKLKLICLTNGREIPVDEKGKFAIYGLRKYEVLKFKATSGALYEYIFEVNSWQILDIDKFRKEAFHYRDSMPLFEAINYTNQMKSTHGIEMLTPDTLIDQVVRHSRRVFVCDYPGDDNTRIIPTIINRNQKIQLNSIGNHAYGYRPSIRVENPFEYSSDTQNSVNFALKQQKKFSNYYDEDYNDQNFDYTYFYRSEIKTDENGAVNVEFVCENKELLNNTCLIDAINDLGEIGHLKCSFQAFQPFEFKRVLNPVIRSIDAYEVPIEILGIDSSVNFITVNFSKDFADSVKVLNVAGLDSFKTVLIMFLNKRTDYLSDVIKTSSGNFVYEQSIRLYSEKSESDYIEPTKLTDSSYPVFVSKMREKSSNVFKNQTYVLNRNCNFGYSYQLSALNKERNQFNSYKLPIFGVNFSDSIIENLAIKIDVSEYVRNDSLQVNSDLVKRVVRNDNCIVIYFNPIPPRATISLHVPVNIFSYEDVIEFFVEVDEKKD